MVGKGIKKGACASEKMINARFFILTSIIIIIIVVKKAVNFIKTTGAKVVKFGLKVAQSVLAVGAKIVSVLPGIGKPIGKIMDGVSKFYGFVDKKIKVPLSHHLQTGMNVMNKALNVMGKF